MQAFAFITEDEEWDPSYRITEAIKSKLEKVLVDTTNKRYSVTVQVSEICDPEPEEPNPADVWEDDYLQIREQRSR